MGYVRNSAARMLKHERSGIIGLVIPDIKNHFYTTVANAIAEAAAAHSFQLILSTTDDLPDREFSAIRSLLELRAEGIIATLCAVPRQETLNLLNRLPAIQLIRHLDHVNKPAVTINDHDGIHAATAHLIGSGHTAIAYIGGSIDLSTGKERLGGFKDAVQTHRLPVNPIDWIKLGRPRPHFGYQAFMELFSQKPHPTALVLGSLELTQGVMKAANELKIRIPDDISMTVYGDSGWYSILHGGMTTVSLPEQEIADGAVSLLFKQIANKDRKGEPQTCENINFTPRLIVRESTRNLPTGPRQKA